ncbi:MAG TPA: AraC family transcriptional regulator ligand-binding domain-containing protein [Xanthobacteraceae bacterium]|nr:AraC family transcriptional regulator ligand-binding domain-containing protein [Xanthobacteraceae bacterium]
MVKIPRSSQSRTLNLPTAAGGLTRAAYARAVKARKDVMPLLNKAGLTTKQMENSTLRLSVESQIKFLNLVAEALEDEFLGFHIGQSLDLREIGILYYVLSSSDTLDSAFERGARYSSITNEGVRLAFCGEKAFELTLRYVGVSRHRDRHQIECFVTALVRLCQHLAGHRLTPIRVTLAHHRGRVSPEFRSFFGCDVTFDSGTDEIAFQRTIGSMPVVSRDPFLNKILVNYCEQAQSERETPPMALRMNVENALVTLLPHGNARADELARKLGMSQRTLARRLESEGLSFALVLDELRHDLATCYLREGHLSISAIAWLLGYKEASAFTHAFRRWTGKTPKEARTTAVSNVVGAPQLR